MSVSQCFEQGGSSFWCGCQTTRRSTENLLLLRPAFVQFSQIDSSIVRHQDHQKRLWFAEIWFLLMANTHPVTIVELLHHPTTTTITITNTPTNKTGTTIRLVQQPEEHQPPTNNKNSHYKLTNLHCFGWWLFCMGFRAGSWHNFSCDRVPASLCPNNMP